MANGLYAAIAEGGKPIQLENPLNQMARIATIRGAEQEQQLNAMRLREAEIGARESEALRNYLSGVTDVSSPEVRARLTTGFGKAGLGYAKQLGEVEKGSLEAQTKRFDLIKNKTNYYRDALATVNTPEDAQIWTAAVFNDPVVGPTVASLGGNLEQALARIPRDPAQFAQWRQQTALGAQKFIELNAPKVNVVDRGGQRDVIRTPGLGGAPTTVGTYSDVPLPESVVQQKLRIAREGRAPAAPTAPTIAQIEDPTMPGRMITIDAKTYRGGGPGSPGVIGFAGKTTKAAEATQKQEQGAQQARDILDTLRTAYDDLDRMRALPSEQRGALSNTLSFVASTGLGQTAGRMVGTKEQTQRDIIASARNQMLNAVKNATGMSAQQLNSNVEFRSWLEALTDPTRSIEANRAILDNMERFIASGGKYTAKQKPAEGRQPTPAPTPTGGSNIDALLDKYN